MFNHGTASWHQRVILITGQRPGRLFPGGNGRDGLVILDPPGQQVQAIHYTSQGGLGSGIHESGKPLISVTPPPLSLLYNFRVRLEDPVHERTVVATPEFGL